MIPTLRLTEYQPRVVHLRRADVAALLADPRRPIDVLPTHERGHYRLTAKGVAGVLLTPHRRIVVRPKIPRANLHLLLDPDAPPEGEPDRTAIEPGTEAIDLLTRRLAELMRDRVASGLRRGYVERTDQQPFLHGRLDTAAQARESPAGRDRFHVTHQEFTADTPFNRIPKATGEYLLASPLVSAAGRGALRAALAGYADVATVPLDLAAFDVLHFDALTEPDRPLLDLCRMLASAMLSAESAGPVAGVAFLLDLERVFERYVERALREFGPEVQREFCYHDRVPAAVPVLTGRPDVVIRRAGRVACVLDAKWKALDAAPPAADVHQALAYAAGLGCRDVRLVYPGRRWAVWRYALTASDVTLTIHTLRVVGPRERCAHSVRRLIRAIESG